MESSRSNALTVAAAIGGVASVLLELLLFLPGSPTGSYLEATFGVTTALMIQLLLGALGIVLLIYPIYVIALAVIRWRRTFDAKIVGKNRFLLGETVVFKSFFKGKLVKGFFTCKVSLPDGRQEWWPAYDTFQRSKEGDVGVLSGQDFHEATWGFQIPRNFPTGKCLVQIGVWDRKDSGSNNLPLKEKSTSFLILSPGYKGSVGTSAVGSGDTCIFHVAENRPKLVITDADLKSDSVKKLVVRFPHGEVREHEVRFYYVKVRNDGEKSVDDVIAHCGANQIRFIPSTEKSTFGLDFDGSETLKEFDRFGIESYVVALIRDHRKVKDEIKYVHPGPVGESFVLFFTLKGYDDRVYVPAHTRIPHNIYGGIYGGRVIGHRKGMIRLFLNVEGRDIEESSAEFEIDFHNWKTFHVKQLDSTNHL